MSISNDVVFSCRCQNYFHAQIYLMPLKSQTDHISIAIQNRKAVIIWLANETDDPR